MLSNVDIIEAMQKGDFAVEPFDEVQLRAAGVTFHLGPNLLKPLPGIIVDPGSGALPEYEEIAMAEGSPFSLHPQEFVLGHTLEKVSVGSSLVLFIEGRSTLARVGLTIVKTAMQVEPGHHDRTITLELANHGPNVILLYPNMKIARAALHELKSPSTKPYDATGKYRSQTGVGRPIFGNEFRS